MRLSMALQKATQELKLSGLGKRTKVFEIGDII